MGLLTSRHVAQRTTLAASGAMEAINNPNCERYSEFSDRISRPFDPNTVNAERLVQAAEELAKQWTRKPAANWKRTN
jgi:hypothetical protein